MRPLKRLHVVGASGWRTRDDEWRMLRFDRAGGHPMAGRWIVQERGLDGEHFAHDFDAATLRECIEYIEA